MTDQDDEYYPGKYFPIPKSISLLRKQTSQKEEKKKQEPAEISFH